MMQISTHAMIIAAAVVQAGMASFDVSRTYLELVTPPPIEGWGKGPDTVIAGDDVLVRWEILKRTECPGENRRQWAGEDGFFMSEAIGPTTLPATTTSQIYMVQTKIPVLAPPGLLMLMVQGWYQCPGNERQEFTLGPVMMEVRE